MTDDAEAIRRLKASAPRGVRPSLELADKGRFGNGMAYMRCLVSG